MLLGVHERHRGAHPLLSLLQGQAGYCNKAVTLSPHQCPNTQSWATPISTIGSPEAWVPPPPRPQSSQVPSFLSARSLWGSQGQKLKLNKIQADAAFQKLQPVTQQRTNTASPSSTQLPNSLHSRPSRPTQSMAQCYAALKKKTGCLGRGQFLSRSRPDTD